MIIPFDELRLKIKFMEQQENNDLKENLQVTHILLKQLFFWIAFIVCALCIFAFFASTDWINSTLDFKKNDSDAGSLLNELASYLLNFAMWLKELPVWLKIVGASAGGAIAFFSYKDDGDVKKISGE